MSLVATQTLYFKFPAISKINMMAMWTSEVGVTLASLKFCVVIDFKKKYDFCEVVFMDCKYGGYVKSMFRFLFPGNSWWTFGAKHVKSCIVLDRKYTHKFAWDMVTMHVTNLR
jgi:hypothetical protein